MIYIGLLAAFWGASYLFIKVADRAFAPASMMMLRLALAASLLLVVLAAQRGFGGTVVEMRARRLQRRDPVYADRLGRAVHRLGRGRDRQRLDADLCRAARDPLAAE